MRIYLDILRRFKARTIFPQSESTGNSPISLEAPGNSPSGPIPGACRAIFFLYGPRTQVFCACVDWNYFCHSEWANEIAVLALVVGVAGMLEVKAVFVVVDSDRLLAATGGSGA